MIRLHSKQLAVFFMAFCIFHAEVPPVAAQGERMSRHGFHHDGARAGHEGGELGGLAALLLGISNLPVALSLSAKALVRFLPDHGNRKAAIKRLNVRQKKYFMKLHYWLNPPALGICILHFWSSECRSTALPELGIGVMLAISILGLILTLKLAPAAARQFVFRLHTSPILTILVFSLLLIGHSVID